MSDLILSLQNIFIIISVLMREKLIMTMNWRLTLIVLFQSRLSV